MYLRTIFELEEEGVVPLRARIAERLHQSGPTVSQTVARMERDGLLTVEGDRHLQLSPVGRELATAVMRKHRLAECLLVDVIGLDYADVHEEACRWEHVMSENVERKLLTLFGNPTVSPFGNPIPGLEALYGGEARGGESPGGPDSLTLLSRTATVDGRRVVIRGGSAPLQEKTDLLRSLRAQGVRPGARTATVDGRRVVIRRISEQLQENTDLLRSLADQGVRPGATALARLVGDDVELDGVPLPAGVAAHLFVTAEDEDLSPLEVATGR